MFVFATRSAMARLVDAPPALVETGMKGVYRTPADSGIGALSAVSMGQAKGVLWHTPVAVEKEQPMG